MSAEPVPSNQNVIVPTLAVADDSAWADVDGGMDDPEEIRVIFCALDSFAQYAKVAHFNVTHLRRRSFYALPQSHWQLLAAPPFNYLETLEKADDAIDSNALFARAILKSGLASFSALAAPPSSTAALDAEVFMPREWAGVAKHSDIDKARSTLRQFYRDWSAAGAGERAASYGPVMRTLEQERVLRGREAAPETEETTTTTTTTKTKRFKVLVPGAGLGRLVFDLCQSGYEAEGNEISYHQLLASSYILNDCPAAEQHTIYPWIHTFSNHLTRANHLRSYPIPDIHPASALAASPDAGSMSMCAADFLCLYGDNAHRDAYDAVASVFFLDTAPNLIRYLEVILHCLRPGGLLINVGPLLWHFENNAPGNHGHDDDEGDAEHGFNHTHHNPHNNNSSTSTTTSGIADPGSFELSNDEVMALVAKMGFEVEVMETGITSPYIQDRESMLQTVYKATFWVARKPRSSADESAAASKAKHPR